MNLDRDYSRLKDSVVASYIEAMRQNVKLFDYITNNDVKTIEEHRLKAMALLPWILCAVPELTARAVQGVKKTFKTKKRATQQSEAAVTALSPPDLDLITEQIGDGRQ